LQRAITNGKIVSEDESDKGGLLYTIVRPKNSPPVLVRARGPRDLAEIPPSEILVVAKKILVDHGLESGSDEHLRAILEYFDLSRLTTQVGTSLLDTLDRSYPYV
jgi:hypothetical protein